MDQLCLSTKIGGKMAKKEKCIFPKMGTRTHQLGRKKNPKKYTEIVKERKKRMDEWKEWWS